MDCVNCNKCENFEKFSWRYECSNCCCPNYFHCSFVKTETAESNTIDYNWTDDIVSSAVQQLDDYKSAMKTAKKNHLLWLPIGIEENNLTEFIETYDFQLGLMDNTVNKLRRIIRIAFQIPKSDCSYSNISAIGWDKVEDPISESEYNFKRLRDGNNLGFGELERVDCNETCFKCQRPYVDSDKFYVLITHSGINSWHVACFQCFECQQLLVDLHYCWHNERSNIFCMRHFDNLDRGRCAGCDKLIFDNDFTKALEKDYHIDHLACKECNQSLTGGKFIVKNDSPLCLGCYEVKYANICERCAAKINCDDKDLAFNNQHWHETCFFCDTCKTSLTNQTFGTKETGLYCAKCYEEKFADRCFGCNNPFKSGVKKFEYATKQYHEECFKCSGCKESIGSKSFVPKDDSVICIQCYEDKYAQKCSKCKGVIRKGGVTYKSEPWHKECFLCTNCKKELSNAKFTSQDDVPYCADCFTKIFSKRCKKCENVISGFGGCKFVSLENDHWHTECFNCTKCDINLVGKGFVNPYQEILCARCGLLDSNRK